MIRAIIIDGEKNSRKTISGILLKNFQNIKIIGEADSVKRGIEVVKKYKPDLLLLDVDLPDGSSFDILRVVDYEKMKLIFITSLRDYAIQAIKLGAFDYILKPYKAAELINALNRASEDSIDNNYADKFDAILSNINSTHPEVKKIVLKTSDKIHVVNINDIIHCQASNTYTTFFLLNKKKIIVSKPIKKYEEMLSEHGFMRIHQSHLVNLNYIQHLNKQEGGILIMTDNSSIPVSNQQKQLLFKYFDTL